MSLPSKLMGPLASESKHQHELENLGTSSSVGSLTPTAMSKSDSLVVATPHARPSVHALDKILGFPFKVLDHGFIRVIDYMGDDSAIVQAARVSYGKGTKKMSEDRGLIRYLMRHRHTTPFEMCSIKFHIKLPIFVARQWIRHRTASVNEYSARYSILDREFYVPSPEMMAVQSTTNGQGRGDTIDHETAAQMIEILRNDATRNYDHYLWLLNEDEEGASAETDRPALARELARINLTLSTYTQWYWKVDLHNLTHFLALRADSHSQAEIRAYADAMMEVLRKWVPITAEAFEDYRVGGVTLSKQMLEVVRQMVANQPMKDDQSAGLSSREWGELCGILGKQDSKGNFGKIINFNHFYILRIEVVLKKTVLLLKTLFSDNNADDIDAFPQYLTKLIEYNRQLVDLDRVNELMPEDENPNSISQFYSNKLLENLDTEKEYKNTHGNHLPSRISVHLVATVVSQSLVYN